MTSAHQAGSPVTVSLASLGEEPVAWAWAEVETVRVAETECEVEA